VAKSELGTKRVCPETGRKFYDLNKSPVISPYTGKVVPIAAPTSSRARPEQARPAAPEEAETVAPETADVEMVTLEDADAEATGTPSKKKNATAESGESSDDDVEMDESMDNDDDDAFIEEEEEGDADVSDIIGDGIEKEEEG
jgi:uncharacterized protein (TIGR02300 family)